MCVGTVALREHLSTQQFILVLLCFYGEILKAIQKWALSINKMSAPDFPHFLLCVWCQSEINFCTRCSRDDYMLITRNGPVNAHLISGPTKGCVKIVDLFQIAII